MLSDMRLIPLSGLSSTNLHHASRPSLGCPGLVAMMVDVDLAPVSPSPAKQPRRA